MSLYIIWLMIYGYNIYEAIPFHYIFHFDAKSDTLTSLEVEEIQLKLVEFSRGISIFTN